MRHMYDATRANAGTLVTKNPEMVAIYLTGTPDIRWTSVEVAFFPRVKTFVRIDQGGITSPQYMANVADVEPHAWSVPDAQSRFLSHCTAPRPTIYCDRNDYRNVTAKCDIWLAAPGLTDTQAVALAKTDKRIVAVQNVFAGSYDRSIVIDPYWPEKAPVTAETVIQVEYYKDHFGWVFPPNGTLLVPATRQIRVRTGKAATSGDTTAVPGTWSDWRTMEA